MATATQPMLTGSSFGAAPITAVDAQMMAQRARMLLMPHDMIMPQPPPTIIESMQPPPPPPPIVEEPPPQEENESIAAEEPPPELPALSQPVEEPPRVVPPPPPASFLASLPTDAADAVVLAARLADAERQIAALQVCATRLFLEFCVADALSLSLSSGRAGHRQRACRVLPCARGRQGRDHQRGAGADKGVAEARGRGARDEREGGGRLREQEQQQQQREGRLLLKQAEEVEKQRTSAKNGLATPTGW